MNHNSNKDNLIVLHINIQRLPKISNLKQYLHDLDQKNLTPDIILICEFYLNDHSIN